jgi:hypothetical protein
MNFWIGVTFVALCLFVFHGRPAEAGRFDTLIEQLGPAVPHLINREYDRRERKQRRRDKKRAYKNARLEVSVDDVDQKSNREKVRRVIKETAFENTPMQFYIDAPNDLENMVAKYIKKLGGSVQSKGNPYFILRISDDTRSSENGYNIILQASIIVIDYNSEVQNRLLNSSIDVNCPNVRFERGCERIRRMALKKLLHSFE